MSRHVTRASDLPAASVRHLQPQFAAPHQPRCALETQRMTAGGQAHGLLGQLAARGAFERRRHAACGLTFDSVITHSQCTRNHLSDYPQQGGPEQQDGECRSYRRWRRPRRRSAPWLRSAAGCITCVPCIPLGMASAGPARGHTVTWRPDRFRAAAPPQGLGAFDLFTKSEHKVNTASGGLGNCGGGLTARRC